MNKLEKYLKHEGIKQKHFAEKIGTTPNNLCRLVKGRGSPSLYLAYEIEKKTGGLVTLYDWVTPENKNVNH